MLAMSGRVPDGARGCRMQEMTQPRRATLHRRIGLEDFVTKSWGFRGDGPLRPSGLLLLRCSGIFG